jgi:SAM-dependent methyltransferase
LEEAWRVLGPGGRALFIVPNRAGMWARRDLTPFGYGRPYSPGQLEAQLRKHQFLPERHVGALYQIPSTRRIWMKSAGVFERIGQHMPTMLAGGAFMVEVTKLVYPPKGKVEQKRKRAPLGVLEPRAKPV